jgi:hypothetical protein
MLCVGRSGLNGDRAAPHALDQRELARKIARVVARVFLRQARREQPANSEAQQRIGNVAALSRARERRTPRGGRVGACHGDQRIRA